MLDFILTVLSFSSMLYIFSKVYMLSEVLNYVYKMLESVLYNAIQPSEYREQISSI